MLDGIDHQPEVAIAAELAQGGEIAAVSVGPLHAADGDDTGARSDAGGEVLGAYFAGVIRDDIDLDAVLLLLDPGDRNLHELKVGNQNAIAGFKRDRIGREGESVGGAFGQRHFVFARIDQTGDSGTRRGAHLVHENVMGGRGLVRTDHGEIEELLDRLDGRARRQRNAGGVEKCFSVNSGKVLTCGKHGSRF